MYRRNYLHVFLWHLPPVDGGVVKSTVCPRFWPERTVTVDVVVDGTVTVEVVVDGTVTIELVADGAVSVDVLVGVDFGEAG